MSSLHARRLASAVAAIVLPLVALPVRAGSAPDACNVHPTRIVNPGCVPSALGVFRGPSIELPDLSPNVEHLFVLPENEFDPATGTFRDGPPLLYFDTHAENRGTVPFDLRAEEVDPLGLSEVSQCVAWTSEVCRARRQVGAIAWHQPHNHYHFQGFASYELRRLGTDGRPDYSDEGKIRSSDKISFCLIDSKQFRPDPLEPRRYTEPCTPIRQGISPGWADVYGPLLDGQQLSLAGVADGRYALLVAVDPLRSLFEADITNNVVEVMFELTGQGTAARIVEKRWP